VTLNECIDLFSTIENAWVSNFREGDFLVPSHQFPMSLDGFCVSLPTSGALMCLHRQ
jgi:hypothetical protein